MAQVIDVFHVSNGPEAALREAQNRSGTLVRSAPGSGL